MKRELPPDDEQQTLPTINPEIRDEEILDSSLDALDGLDLSPEKVSGKLLRYDDDIADLDQQIEERQQQIERLRELRRQRVAVRSILLAAVNVQSPTVDSPLSDPRPAPVDESEDALGTPAEQRARIMRFRPGHSAQKPKGFDAGGGLLCTGKHGPHPYALVRKDGKINARWTAGKIRCYECNRLLGIESKERVAKRNLEDAADLDAEATS